MRLDGRHSRPELGVKGKLRIPLRNRTMIAASQITSESMKLSFICEKIHEERQEGKVRKERKK
jgi:hypothetical protein